MSLEVILEGSMIICATGFAAYIGYTYYTIVIPYIRESIK
jgi:hypothetical protein